MNKFSSVARCLQFFFPRCILQIKSKMKGEQDIQKINKNLKVKLL